MPTPTSPSAIPCTSSMCRPVKSAICANESAVFSTSQTAVAFGINGLDIDSPFADPPQWPGRHEKGPELRDMRLYICGFRRNAKRG